MTVQVAPRIYCLPAVAAPVVAVFRRGPTRWSHLGRWLLEPARYEPGAWLRGRLFPRRSDLSPDGQWLCYFAHKPTATWPHGETYVAVSKLPWLTALQAFGTCGTWTRGYYFADSAAFTESDKARAIALPIAYSLCPIPVVQFANERRRGWVEAPDSPPRHPQDVWDERRNARLQKRQPGGKRLLCLESVGHAGGEFGVEQAVDGLRCCYSLISDGNLEILDDLQWADWDATGRLLAATRCGKLQIRQLEASGAASRARISFETDLSALAPAPSPAPDWAQRW
ncbi:MAG: hypothetical protein F6J97_12020 [Leptolyngbya sp. SIO4C1]|nr:hypothetical protein [Leptolyngbya sp. SIO4C1]